MILIVEDEAVIGWSLQQVLRLHGRSAIVTRDALHALREARSSTPELIIADLHMPGTINGWEFLDALEADPVLAKVPVVVVTGYADVAKLPPRVVLLTKPVVPEEMLQVIDRLAPRGETTNS